MKNPSNIAYDSLVLHQNWFEANTFNTIGAIIQDSIKWEKFKILAIYLEDKYIGNYEVSSKVTFDTQKFPDIFCRLLWNKPKENCTAEIRSLRKWGKYSESMKFALVSLHYHSTNPAYKINRIQVQIEKFESETKQNEYPF
ncbi:MAG: hypothetical protein MUF45_10020 [Spirosomaceae bacterium]|jgi:hypothetical protein|nr:hypothetical protein [Spirosomataceae bacterium]